MLGLGRRARVIELTVMGGLVLAALLACKKDEEERELPAVDAPDGDTPEAAAEPAAPQPAATTEPTEPDSPKKARTTVPKKVDAGGAAAAPSAAPSATAPALPDPKKCLEACQSALAKCKEDAENDATRTRCFSRLTGCIAKCK